MNKLIQCEALEGLADVPPASIPLVVTSPPWGNTRLFGGHVFDFKPVASELWRVIEPGGVVCWHHQDQIENGSESCEHCHQLLYFERLGFRRHQTITVVYHKYRRTPRRYYRVASQVYVLSKGSPRIVNLIKNVRNTNAGSQMDMKLRDKDGLSRRRMFRVTQEIGYRGDVWEYLIGWMKMCEDLAALEHGSVMHRDPILLPVRGFGFGLLRRYRHDRCCGADDWSSVPPIRALGRSGGTRAKATGEYDS